MIVCGVQVGRYAFVGAGAVVTRQVPDHALVFGNPAGDAAGSASAAKRLTPTCTVRFAAKSMRRGLRGLRPLAPELEPHTAAPGLQPGIRGC